jgi:hypothetical protein
MDITEDRVKQINKASAAFLEDLLEQMENEELTSDDLFASLYAGMVAAYLYGYSPDGMVVDAKAAAERLLALAEETEESLPEVTTCKHKDENGNCPLHNLHCQYPDCEKNG